MGVKCRHRKRYDGYHRKRRICVWYHVDLHIAHVDIGAMMFEGFKGELDKLQVEINTSMTNCEKK